MSNEIRDALIELVHAACDLIDQAQSVGLWGRRAWKQWYPAITKKLVSEQQPDGRWNGSYGYYASSMALLVLEIPYRYLPIYQR